MKVTIIPILIGVFGRFTKGLLKGLEDLEIREWVETIQIIDIIDNGQNTKTSPGNLLSLKL